MSNSTSEVAFDENAGNIYCLLCSRNSPRCWSCGHVMGAFMYNIDLLCVQDILPVEIKIPMSSKHDLWATVEIDGFAGGLPGQNIVLHDGEPLCIIGQTEGRRVIRTALLNKMDGDFNFNRSCSSSTHGPKEEKVWAREVLLGDEQSTDRIAQLWTVYTTSICIPCNDKVDAAIRGLAPDRQGSSVWNQQ